MYKDANKRMEINKNRYNLPLQLIFCSIQKNIPYIILINLQPAVLTTRGKKKMKKTEEKFLNQKF